MRSLFFVLAIVAVLIASCGGNEKNEKNAKAPKFMPTPLPVQAQSAGWQGVTINTLCLAQNLNHFGSYYDFSNLKKEIGIIFSRMGFQVVDEGQPCDATLTINLTGEALGASYEMDLYCYTGSAVNGDFMLSAPGRETITAHVYQSWPTSEAVQSNNCPDADHAPYLYTLVPAVLDGLAALYGPVVYGWIVVEEGEETWCGSDHFMPCGYFYNDLLERLDDSSALAAVPPLIVALDSETEQTRKVAASKLQAITGQTFGSDKAAWENWWASAGVAIPTGAAGGTGLTIGTLTPTVDMNAVISETATALAAPMIVDTPTSTPPAQ